MSTRQHSPRDPRELVGHRDHNDILGRSGIECIKPGSDRCSITLDAQHGSSRTVNQHLPQIYVATLTPIRPLQTALRGSLRRIRPRLSLFTLLILFPALAVAQSPFDTGFTAMQTLFTGTVAKVASLIAIVVGGYQFAHGEPGAKKTLAGVAAGTGIAVLATNVLTWLWGV